MTDDKFKEVLELLAVSANIAWTNTLCGRQSPAQDYYFEQMKSPVVGDLVLETSSIGNADAIDRLGRLLSITREPMKNWDPDDDDPPLETIWTIETFDGRKFAWSNADFIVVPEDAFKHKGRLVMGQSFPQANQG